MKIVVVGGQVRKVGKTSVMAGLIAGLRSLGWTAVKVSRHDAGVPHAAGTARDHELNRLGFILTEEKSASPDTDTGRFLLAGAKRAFWLRACTDQLESAIRALRRALAGERHVIIESTGAMGYLSPAVSLFVLDSSRRHCKPITLRALAQADVIVCVGTTRQVSKSVSWIPHRVPAFSVPRSTYSHPELCRFVKQKLRTASNSRSKSRQPSQRTGIAERR